METVTILIKIAFSLFMGILAGSTSVYAFNRIPAKWLCDYNQEPDREMWGERIKKHPWTAVFILVFAAASMKLVEQGFLYAIPGVASLWILLQIGMADRKYKIIPDQFVIALAAAALGLIPYHSSFLSLLAGALAGGGSILTIGIVGKLAFKKEAMGFGDVKLFTAIGLMLGLAGVVAVLLLTIFSSAFVFGIGLILGKLNAKDEQPLGPFIAVSTSLYVLFRAEILAFAGFFYS